MPAHDTIQLPGQLPRRWQREWMKCKDAYIRSGRFKSYRQAELAAFDDIKKQYLAQMANVIDRAKTPAD